MGIIITPSRRRTPAAPVASRWSAGVVDTGGVAQNQFFQSGQHARAQSADGPRGHFEHPDARGFTRISAWMGPCVRPSAFGWRLRVVRTMARCVSRIFARRRDVDGLFEERTIERIGLVEKREHAELAMRENAFQREFAAFDEGFHLQEAVLIFVEARDVGIGQQVFDAAESRDELAGLLARITPRLAESPSGLSTQG
jgi:hypothetical protein